MEGQVYVLRPLMVMYCVDQCRPLSLRLRPCNPPDLRGAARARHGIKDVPRRLDVFVCEHLLLMWIKPNPLI